MHFSRQHSSKTALAALMALMAANTLSPAFAQPEAAKPEAKPAETKQTDPKAPPKAPHRARRNPAGHHAPA